MKLFEAFAFDPEACREQLIEFKGLLGTSDELDEAQDVLPFFRARKHLSAFIGSLNPNVHVFDRLATEYDLFGDFTCDLAVGDSGAHAYTLVEFEDAKRHSIFQQSGGYTPRWATRFEHGFSQLIDWFWKIEDQQRTDDYRHRFGEGVVRFFGVLVIGRTAFLDGKGRRRLDWRFDRVVVNSRAILCLTYDDLHQQLERKLNSMRQMPASEDHPAAEGGPGQD